MELDNILKLIDHVSKSELSSFSLDEDGTSIKMEAGRISVTASPDNMAVMASDVEIKPAKTEQQHGSNAAVTQIQGNVVSSPLVGVFYEASSPDADAFVAVGDKVVKGQTLGIIEAMKLMNEIESEYEGTVLEVLVKDKDTVEYGQPLFVIG